MADCFRIMGHRRAGITPDNGCENANQDGVAEELDIFEEDEVNTEKYALSRTARLRIEHPTYKVWCERLVVGSSPEEDEQILVDVMQYLHWKELFVIFCDKIEPATAHRNEISTWRDHDIRVIGWDGPFASHAQASIALYSRQDCVNRVFRVSKNEIDWDGF